MAAEENGVRVTQQVIYETLMEVKTQVAILNDKIPVEIEKTDKEIEDHEIRIRRLERQVWLIAGAAAAAGSTVANLLNTF